MDDETSDPEIEHEITDEDVPKIEEGEPQKIQIHVRTDYGDPRNEGLHLHANTSVAFSRSEKQDGYLWDSAMQSEQIDQSIPPFTMYNVLAIEAAATYIEEHYGPVVNSVPTMPSVGDD